MPNLSVPNTYISKMVAVEDVYLRSVDVERKKLRSAMLDIITRDGASLSAVGQMKSEVQQLRRTVATLSRQASAEIRKVTANYTRKQIEVAQKAGLPTVPAEQVIMANTGTQFEGESAFMTSSPMWIDTLEATIETTSAQLRLSGADESSIIKRMTSTTAADGRVSVWQSSGSLAQTEETKNLWTYANLLIAAYLFTLKEQTGANYQKQAIATIDGKTTDCCLRVHGQIRPLGVDFKLVGTPRFSDYVAHPPFHWRCRTTEVLYSLEFESFGVTTKEMRSAATAELNARFETGKRVDIYPSHATAHRPNEGAK